jgi:thioredoxin-related protein
MKKLVLTAFVVLAGYVLCLSQSIHNQALNWNQLKAKAQKENKYIFMDCYATWCVPCKWMDKNILSDTTVKNYLDQHFISVKLQMDSTTNDNDEVKSWYQDARRIQKELMVNVYPTYLFFSPNGEPVHRFEGSTETTGDFIHKVSQALRPDKQFYTLIKEVNQLPADSVSLHSTIEAAQALKKIELADSLIGVYLSVIKDPLDLQNIKFIYFAVRSSRHAGFLWLVNNHRLIDERFKKGASELLIASIIQTELMDSVIRSNKRIITWTSIKEDILIIYPKLPDSTWVNLQLNYRNAILNYELTKKYTTQNKSPDWNRLKNLFKHRYPDIDAQALITKAKPMHYIKLKDWEACAKAVVAYVSSEDIPDNSINGKIWDFVFMKTMNQKVLQAACKLSKGTVDRNPQESNYMDTYANLLYKTGNRNAAIEWEEHALKLERSKPQPNQSLIKEFEKVLEKMKNNIRTWEN